MSHAHYHNFHATDHYALGCQLGEAFGAIMRDYIDEARECPDWLHTVEQSVCLLRVSEVHFPVLVEELRGYAAGARVPFQELWALMAGDELGDEQPERCTTVVTNEGRLIAHNEDWAPDAVNDICIVSKTIGESHALELYYYGCPLGGAALSIHSNGFIQAINSLDHSDRGLGVPKLLLARRISEVRNVSAELDALLAVPRASGFAHTLVHRDGATTSVECTGGRHAICSPQLPYVHTNHTLSPALASLDEPEDEKSTFRRYDYACRRVRPSLSLADMKDMMSNSEQGNRTSVFNRNTIAQVIVDLDHAKAHFWLHREKRKGWIAYDINFFIGG